MDSAYKFAKFLAEITYENIPAELVELIKNDVLDTLGTILAGSHEFASKEAFTLFQEWGGKQEATVVGFDAKLPAPHAALVNGTSAAALDYDDTLEAGRVHVGGTGVSAAFAMAESLGRVNGKEFITALCGGIELSGRLGMASIRRVPGSIMGGWDYSSLHGTFATAAIAGRLLKLDAERMRNALGIAYHQAGGNCLSAIDEGHTKMLGVGFASRTGIISAFMASRGLTGAKNVFDDSIYSLTRLYHKGTKGELLTQGLGKEYVGKELSFKPYPCCRLGHRQIDAIIKLVAEHDIQPNEVEKIIVHTSKVVENALCDPIEKKKIPQSKIEAQFSLPWMLAGAIYNRRLGISDFTEEVLAKPEILTVAAKVNSVLDPGLTDESTPALVKIVTRRGTFEVKTGMPYGSVENSISQSDLEAKFLDCACFARKKVSHDNLKKLILLVRELENLEDVSEIIRLLA